MPYLGQTQILYVDVWQGVTAAEAAAALEIEEGPKGRGNWKVLLRALNGASMAKSSMNGSHMNGVSPKEKPVAASGT